MGLLSKLRKLLFDAAESPDDQYSDLVLGPMRWVEDDEAWFGEYRDTRYSLAYERQRHPSPELVEYARKILDGFDGMLNSLDQAKRTAVSEYGDSYASEIAALRFGRVHFYRHRDIPRVLADLEGGREDRLWRIEYAGEQCEGIGFDD